MIISDLSLTVLKIKDMDRKEIIKNLLLEENVTVVKNNKVKKVVIEPAEVNRIPVKVTFEKPIKMYIAVKDEAGNPTDEWEVGETNTWYTTNFVLAAILSDNDDTSIIADEVIEKPRKLKVLLKGATMDLLQIDIQADEEFGNPFSSDQSKKQVCSHPLFDNHGYNLNITDSVRDKIDAMEDALLMS